LARRLSRRDQLGSGDIVRKADLHGTARVPPFTRSCSLTAAVLG
jgi:hypothetical protein